MAMTSAEARQGVQTHECTLAGLVGLLQQLTTTLGQSATAPVVTGDDSAPVNAPASGLIQQASADLEPLGVPECYDRACKTCRPFPHQLLTLVFIAVMHLCHRKQRWQLSLTT